MTPDDSASMWLTLREAAEAFDVSLSTLHRRRRRGDLEDVGAFKDNDGNWKVPRQGLAQLGFKEIVPPQVPGQVTLEETVSDRASESPATTPPDTPVTPSDTAELERLREQLEVERREKEEEALHRKMAEAVAAERLERIKDLQHSMRLLEPAAADRRSPDPATEPQRDPEPSQPERKSWWRRILG